MNFTIGEFSNIVRISSKTLRYYDSIGLFCPQSIDTNTGYRYYTENQIEDILFIIELRKYDFSLTEIKEMLTQRNTDILREKLCNKLDYYDDAIEKLIQQKRDLKTSINAISNNKPLWDVHRNETFSIKTLKKKFVFHEYFLLPYDNWLQKLQNKLDICILTLKAKGIETRQSPIVLYHFDHEKSSTDSVYTEICIEVVKTKFIENEPGFKTIDEGTFACAMHTGSVSTDNYLLDLRQMDRQFMQWIVLNEYKIIGTPMEIILKPPTPNDLNRIVEYYAPIQK